MAVAVGAAKRRWEMCFCVFGLKEELEAEDEAGGCHRVHVSLRLHRTP